MKAGFKSSERLKIIKIFNKNLKAGLKEILDPTKTPEENNQAIVKFFIDEKENLNLAHIGEYLGAGENAAVLTAFINDKSMQFAGQPFVGALRLFLESFKLPGEAQKIDRLMEAFATKYVEQNPRKEGAVAANAQDIAIDIANADAAYVLAFQVIMLNTDLHSHSVRQKMTLDQMVNILRGVNDKGNFDRKALEGIYNDIKTTPFKLNFVEIPTTYKSNLSNINDQKTFTHLITQLRKNQIDASEFPSLKGIVITKCAIDKPWYSFITGYTGSITIQQDNAEVVIQISQPGLFSKNLSTLIAQPKETEDLELCRKSIALAAQVMIQFQATAITNATYDYIKQDLEQAYSDAKQHSTASDATLPMQDEKMSETVPTIQKKTSAIQKIADPEQFDSHLTPRDELKAKPSTQNPSANRQSMAEQIKAEEGEQRESTRSI